MPGIQRNWSIEEALETYNVANWGQGYVSISAEGHVLVHPRKRAGESIDLKVLVDQIRRRGIALPLLLRFTDILDHRVLELNQAFQAAIAEFDYESPYLGIYPIKTNQQRHVVEEVVAAGQEFGSGLECGSKPELLAVLALSFERDPLIVCNGFKDDEYLELVVYSQKMGKRVIPVIEKFSELELLLHYGREFGVKPQFGVRVKLATRGSGRWKLTGGPRSKFGLTVTELLECLEVLDREGLRDGFRLLHFHLGSQITNILAVKNAITEASRIYVELRRECPALDILDVGGGLGVDYDGSQTNFESSMNYSLEEYARDVIFRVKSVCEEAGVPHPTVVTEAGRATVAHHSVLVFDVLGSSPAKPAGPPPEIDSSDHDIPQPLRTLQDISSELTKKNVLESYHDLIQTYEEALHTFKLGFLSLRQRSQAEQLFQLTAERILAVVQDLDYVPEDLEGLENQLAETYFCNFSIFQSLPDSWAIQQLFPILPIHRLAERPGRRAILADITCDSDGKIDRFIDLRDVKKSLELHELDDQDYFLAVFLVGAYQEILGDLHNLFGDTNSVHVALDADGEVKIEQVVKGDSVEEVLAYVQYSSEKLSDQVRRDVEFALRKGRIDLDDARKFLRLYENGLRSYTYLTRRPEGVPAAPPPREDRDPPAAALPAGHLQTGSPDEHG